MCWRLFSTDSVVSSQAGQWNSTREMSSVPPDFKGAWIQTLWYLHTKAGGWRSEVQGDLQLHSEFGAGTIREKGRPLDICYKWSYQTAGATSLNTKWMATWKVVILVNGKSYMMPKVNPHFISGHYMSWCIEAIFFGGILSTIMNAYLTSIIEGSSSE